MSRTEDQWKTGVGGTYIQTIAPAGYDILINGTSKYLNFNTTVGSSGYGIRDNAGVMEFKDSGGSWASFGTGGGGYTNLTEFVAQTPWRIFYSDTNGDVTELALGASGTFLQSNGASSAPSFAVPAGSGDVSKVGTPVDNQVGVWTGDGTLEGDANLTYDGTALALGASKNITMTGDIASSGSRVANGYFANLNVGSSGTLTFVTLGSKNVSINQATISFNDQSDGNAIRLVGSSTTGANQTITLPDATGTVMLTSAIGSTVQAYDADLTTWAGITPGTGVGTALAINVGSAGAFVTFNGAGGTPSSLTGTNITGTASGLTAGTVTTNANLTGHITSTGNATLLGSFTKAQLSTAVSDGDPLYVGDVTTNATHTGDATGSGALTVVAINGTTLSGLATGILKNTTATGVPSIAVAGDFPTLNQNTTGSAATLTTTRTIWGQNFNGSANVTGTLALGTADLTLTGSIGATGARATKVWTAALESTAMPTVNGTSLSSTFQGLDTQLTSLAALSYTGNAGKFIRVNAGETDFELAAVAGSGTVTSVAMSVPTGLTVSGSPITTTGTLAVALDTGYVIPLQATLDGFVTEDQTVGQTIGATGARLTKLWATDITVTNAITGSVTGNAGTVTNATLTTALTVNTGTLTLTANAANTSVLTIGAGAVSISGSNTGDQTTVSGNAGTATALQNARTIGGVSFDGTANIVPQTIQSVNEATDTTCFPLFISASGSQSLQPLNNTSLTFNSNTGALGATSFVGAGTSLTGIPYSLTGTANQVTLSAATGNITFSLPNDLRITSASVGTNADSIPTLSSTSTLTNKTLTSPTLTTPSAFTTGGTITLAENTSIALDPAGSADGKYTGITVTGTGGATIAFGDLVTLDKDDSRWELVDISVAAAATGDARGICGIAVTSSTDGTAITVLLNGIIRADANFPALTIGAAVYASTTGDIVVTQPSTTDHVIRVVGYALTADEIYFNPENDWITHT